MLIAAGGHIIIVYLSPIVVLIACVYYLGAELLEWIKTWRPETRKLLATVGMLIGVFVIVVFIFFVACLFDLTPRPAYSPSSSSGPSFSEEVERLRGMEVERIEAERGKRAQVAQVEAERATEEQAARVAQEQVKKEDVQKRLFAFRLKRANDGAAEAQYDLALQYLTGQGVARDITAAKDWLQKAAAQGHKKAQKQLESLAATDTPTSPK